jgi:hypothetical protein
MELLTEGSELAIAAPWRFDSPEVEFTVAGHLAPAGRHLTPADLLASATPKNIRWRLISGEKRGETPAIRRS